MKTKEELINLGAEYYRKCGKHLFTKQTPLENKPSTFKHVFLHQDGDDYYGCEMEINTKGEVTVTTCGIGGEVIYKSYGGSTIREEVYPNQYSDKHFTHYEKFAAIKQNKYMREMLSELKSEFTDKFRPDKKRYSLETSAILEKSGS